MVRENEGAGIKRPDEARYSETAIFDAIAEELVDQFYDSEHCGVRIRLSQGRLIASAVLSRLARAAAAGEA
jgi:hypothetical protein